MVLEAAGRDYYARMRWVDPLPAVPGLAGYSHRIKRADLDRPAKDFGPRPGLFEGGCNVGLNRYHAGARCYRCAESSAAQVGTRPARKGTSAPRRPL
jgi:hypothetical protein